MPFRSICGRLGWRAAFIAAALWTSAAPALAGDALVADVNGDGRADRIAVVTRQGAPALRLSIAGGRTLWLHLSKPVLRLAASDIDHDGDLDLIASTDGTALLAWMNHGRGWFTPTIIDPRPEGSLGSRSASLTARGASYTHDFGIGADDAVLTGFTPSAPVASRIRPFYSSPAGLHRVSAPYGSRAPPLF